MLVDKAGNATSLSRMFTIDSIAPSVAIKKPTGDKVNINTASIEQLVQLDRVGPKYAARIVEFRDQNGPFKTPEDLMQVAGIGPKTFEANKDRIVVE